MGTNALGIANYFLELAQKDTIPVQPLKLIKLVYIAYGFGLAVFNRSMLDYRFDKVEAWKYGPVIPSVYHSFKQHGRNPIPFEERAVMIVDEQGTTVTPDLNSDTDAKRICDFVWKKYALIYEASDLVTLLHKEGTPWWFSYEEGMNNPIPENVTKDYYTDVFNGMYNEAKTEANERRG